MKDAYVLDTNIFFNLEINTGLGKSPKEIINNFVSIIQSKKFQKKAECYMPPSIADEMRTFVLEDEKVLKVFFENVIIKSPDISKSKFPGVVFYKIVEEIRERSYRGLKIAEEMILESAQSKNILEEENKVEIQKIIGSFLTRFRSRYRQATRYNFLDSTADLDLIVLSKELDGFLVSADEGVVRWGRMFGIKELSPSLMRDRFLSL